MKHGSPNPAHQQVEKLLAASGLPPEICARIRETLDPDEMPAYQATDVAQELIAHFQDGLRAGHTERELLEEFGAATTAATWIAKEKRMMDAEHRPIARVSPRGDTLLATTMRDIRYAFRRMRQKPGFAFIAIASLAIAIGANTAIFGLVNAVLLRDRAVQDRDTMVQIYTIDQDFDYNIFSYPDYADLRDRTADVFSHVSATGFNFAAVDKSDGVENVLVEIVDGDYFLMRGVRAHLGRTLLPDDDVAPGAHAVVVLGYNYWQQAFGGDPDILGRELRLNGRQYSVVGIADELYQGNLRGFVPAMYLPIQMANELNGGTFNQLDQRNSHGLFISARRKPGVSQEQAKVSVTGVVTDLRARYPDDWYGQAEANVIPAEDVVIWPVIDGVIVTAAGMLLALVGLVLLIACANLASFLLARAMDRRREIALRVAIGATRGTLIRQLLVETTLVAMLSGIAGIGLAVVMMRALMNVDLPLPVDVTLDLGIDGPVLLFTLGVSLMAGLVFGLVPALQGSRADLASTLKDESAGGGQRGRSLLRNVLVTGQVAMSVLLLVSAGLFIRSLGATKAVDPGFGYAPAAAVSINIPSLNYTQERGRLLQRTLFERIRELPGVTDVGLTTNLHLNQFNQTNTDVLVDGFEPPPGLQSHPIAWAAVDSGFFAAAGIDILRGRNFGPADIDSTALVAVISEAMAVRFWPNEDAVGRHYRRPDGRDVQVVGIARDAKVRSLGEPPRPFVYLAHSQLYRGGFTIVAKTLGNAEATSLDILRTARALDPDLMIAAVTTVERHLGIVLIPARLGAVVLTGFAIVALLLAAIGLYGIVSYAVASRTREVGIRVSLGADRARVIRLLMGGGMRLVMAGSIIGLLASLALAQLMGSLLFGIGALDPVTFTGVPIVLITVAACAAYLPARRAGRVSPVVALKAE